MALPAGCQSTDFSPASFGCNLGEMSSGQQLRSRLVIALALCAVLWSDPAFAALACTQMPGCPQHAARLQQPPPVAASHLSVADAKPCCPMHAGSPFQRPADMPGCCAWRNADSLVPARLFSSRQSPSKQLAELTAAHFPSASLAGHSPLSRCETAAFYIKPVDQKKTDLRI